MLLDNLTPEKAEKARTTEITTAYGTLFDKRRMLQGKSTSNQELIFRVVVDGQSLGQSDEDKKDEKTD